MNAINAVISTGQGLVRTAMRVPAQIGQKANSMVAGSGAKQLWPLLKKDLAPPPMDSLPQAQQHVFKLLDSAKKMKFLDVTVKEAVANALVAVEIGCWFYLGEMIGRRHIIGYSIPNTHH